MNKENKCWRSLVSKHRSALKKASADLACDLNQEKFLDFMKYSEFGSVEIAFHDSETKDFTVIWVFYFADDSYHFLLNGNQHLSHLEFDRFGFDQSQHRTLALALFDLLNAYEVELMVMGSERVTFSLNNQPLSKEDLIWKGIVKQHEASLRRVREDYTELLYESVLTGLKCVEDHPYRDGEYRDVWQFSSETSHHFLKCEKRFYQCESDFYGSNFDAVKISKNFGDFHTFSCSEDCSGHDDYEFFQGTLKNMLHLYKSALKEMKSPLVEVSYQQALVSTDTVDRNGNEIFVGQSLQYKGEQFRVEMNDFFGQPFISGDVGQFPLSQVHHDCEVA